MQLMIWLIGEYSRKYKMNSLFLHKSIITLLSGEILPLSKLYDRTLLRNTNGDCRLIKKIPDVRPLEEDLPD